MSLARDFVLSLGFALAILGCGTPTPTTTAVPVTPAPVMAVTPVTTSDAAAPVAGPPIVEDPAATAAEMYDPHGHNYVAPQVLAYGRTPHLVIYPACRGGEGPGESCDVAALDHAGKDAALGVQIHWATIAGRTQDREPATRALEQLLVASDAVRLSKQAWRGDPVDVAGVGTVRWDPAQKALIATRGAATTQVPIAWGDRGGPVALYTSPSAPVAVALLRLNPASGGREGYVVSVQYAVVPRP